MKYTESITLNQPRSQVVECFDDPVQQPSWQPDLIDMEPVDGIPGQQGSKMQLVYRMGQREVELLQTVTLRNLPHEFAEQFENPYLWILIHHRFSDLEGQRTLWHLDCEVSLRGQQRWLGWLSLGLFRRQTRIYLRRFNRLLKSP